MSGFSSLSDLGPGCVVTGGAGAGKTTMLVSILQEIIPSIIFKEHHAIPVISAMHGARRRLFGRLRSLQQQLSKKGQKVTFDVCTLDSFALALANRYRRSVGLQETPFQPELSDGGFDQIIEAAIATLKNFQTRRLIAETFPLIVIDELQDCKGKKLEFLQQLPMPIISAADEFQDITPKDHTAPAVAWARNILRHHPLPEISHRTKDRSILNTAAALREGTPATGPVISCFPVKAAGIAASTIMTMVRERNWIGSLALLSFKMADKFPSDVITSLHKQRKLGEKMQPLLFHVQPSEDEYFKIVASEFTDFPASVGIKDASFNLSRLESKNAWNNVVYKERRKGNSTVSRDAILKEVRKIVHFNRSFGVSPSKRIAMAIHSAKNQEWDNVIILWSGRQFRSGTTEEYQRRLLYNAVTRSKLRCLLLVYDPDGKFCRENQVIKLIYNQSGRING